MSDTHLYFAKFPSLENHYREKELARWLELYPELSYTSYAILEKLDGANIQFIFFPEERSFAIASRNQIIPRNENFFGVWDLVLSDPILKEFTAKMSEVAIRQKMVFNIYGELIGPSIMRRVDYGEKKIRFFSSRTNLYSFGKRLFTRLEPFLYTRDLFIGLGLKDLLAPTLAVLNGEGSLQNALDYDINFDSVIVNRENNTAEGIVITPLSTMFHSPVGETFILKKKHEKFAEKKQGKKNKEVIKIPDEVQELKEKFGEYINENRIQSLFSKIGVISSESEIGKYLKLVIEDAWSDFEKDHDVSEVGSTGIKYITNFQKDIVVLLKNHL